MKKYVTPELEITKFAAEDIMTASSGGNLQSNKLTVAEENGSVANFENGSLEFVQ